MNDVEYRVLALFMITGIIASMFFIIDRTNSAFACECMSRRTVTVEFNAASAVFSGTVIEITSDNVSSNIVRFDVEKAWKGLSGNTATILTGYGGGDCGADFEKSEKYLVYAFASDGSLDRSLYTSSCSRTELLEYAQEDLSVLGAEWRIYKLNYEGQVFKIPYKITGGDITSIAVAPDFTSMILVMESDGGTIEIVVPRNLVDSKLGTTDMDDDFIVLVNGEERDYEEINNSPCFRALSIEFPAASEDIEIIGGGVPETIRPIEVHPVYLTTDKNNYAVGETITISGCTNLALDDNEVIIEVLNPEGRLYRKTSVTPDIDG